MDTIELARKMAKYNQTEDAQRAYFLVLQEMNGKNPDLELEAASYIFFSEGNYQTAYTTFVSLYNRGCFQNELMDLMTQAFYLPNIQEQKKQYEKNCKLLSKYPYLFRKDFLSFEELPIQFFPFNDRGVLPYYRTENRFGEFVDFSDPVIDRYFFKDLENPILAEDVYSQYQLEYLRDNVRKSEWIGRENHIYLHYTDWAVFCAHLACLSFQKLLQSKQFVFLIEDEVAQYPIDFQARFGIDYTCFKPRPVGVQEINRLIWHTQLSTHNGGDFFNEVFYGHPNLLIIDSIMFENVKRIIQEIREGLRLPSAQKHPLLRHLRGIKTPSDKDCLVAVFLYDKKYGRRPDPTCRIVPALFFQPHFGNIIYDAKVVDTQKGWTTLYSDQFEEVRNSSVFRGFPYIKTFTPMRRITTSFAATTRYMVAQMELPKDEGKAENHNVWPDLVNLRLLNRSFMVDPWNKLYHDSILVRFEDGKLNPKATFTALAEFLDIPYTESMTYCTTQKGINVAAVEGNIAGFDPASVYKTYDEYAGTAEREYLEFFFRDAYAFYGYDFQYYKGEPVDEAWVREKISQFDITDGLIARSWESTLRSKGELSVIRENGSSEQEILTQKTEEDIQAFVQKMLEQYNKKRVELASYLLQGLNFINGQGQPLQMMKPLKLDPALLEQPLYH